MVLVGTSGWSYDEWVGPFYPVSLRGQPTEWLRYYAGRFRTVEIASTFYAFPGEDLVASWARAGAELAQEAPFEFSLKTPRAVTHEALADGDVDGAWELAARFERHVLEPLADDGLLGAVLLQLPPGLRPEGKPLAALREVLRALEGRQVAVEARDASWVVSGRIAPEARPLFDGPDVALVEVDGGVVPRLDTRPPRARHAYFRLRGRNGTSDNDEGAARHDYLYSSRELAPFAQRLAEAASEERVVRAYFNNTPRAKGVVNAVELMHLMGEAPHVPRPRLTEQTKLPV